MEHYLCPVCGYDALPEPPAHQLICPSCGTQFGLHDVLHDVHQLRQRWLMSGPRWISRRIPEPPDWDWRVQLMRVDRSFFTIDFTSDVSPGKPERPPAFDLITGKSSPSVRAEFVTA